MKTKYFLEIVVHFILHIVFQYKKHLTILVMVISWNTTSFIMFSIEFSASVSCSLQQ